MLHLFSRVWPARAIQERAPVAQPRSFLLPRSIDASEKARAPVLPSVFTLVRSFVLPRVPLAQFRGIPATDSLVVPSCNVTRIN